MKLPLIAIALLPVSLAAQAPERSSFYLTLGKDTVISERVWRTDTDLHGEFLDHNRGARLEYVAALGADASITRLAVHSYRGAADTTGDIAVFSVAQNEIVAQMGNAPAVRMPSQPGVVLVVNPSIAFVEQMVLHARALNAGSKVSFPVLILGSPQPVNATVTFVSADSAVLDYSTVSMHLALSATGRVLGGAVPAQGVVIRRGPAGDPLVATRKDYGAPAGAPYGAEEVTVQTPAGLRLTGTLTMPKIRPGGRVPAVVTITGSGAEDRDETAAALPGYHPFREIADTLGRRGIAVLRLDDRGVNGSDRGPSTATSADFADDIRAAVEYLRHRPEVDGARIALLGHSEGGVIAPLVAQTDPKLRGIVLMAASASPGRAILSSQQHYVVDTVAKLTGAKRDAALAQYARNTDSVAAAVPWMRWFIDHDPAAVARRVKTPVLILQGENDHQVPAAEAKKLAAAFRAGGNTRATVRLFHDTNHLFVTDTIGGFSYEKLPSLAVRKDVLGAIADWLSSTLR